MSSFRGREVKATIIKNKQQLKPRVLNEIAKARKPEDKRSKLEEIWRWSFKTSTFRKQRTGLSFPT